MRRPGPALPRPSTPRRACACSTRRPQNECWYPEAVMALLFRRSNALLLLVPKTGSTWIRAKVAELGLDVAEVGDPAMREHDLLAHFDRARYACVGAFVRNPIDWYRSYWAYRMERGWRPQYALDAQCQSENFETFVRLAVSTLPGALGNIYNSYT